MPPLEDQVRLHKYLADQGVASRRHAETMIREGRVTVDGQEAEIGQKVTPGTSEVRVDGRLVGRRPKKRIVLALNKPRHVLCSHDDPHHDRTIYDLVPPPWAGQRLICIGRLDKESEGLLLLTNDGELAQRVSHPSFRVRKRYRVELDKPFDPADSRKMLNGITWEGERLRVERVIPQRPPAPVNQIEVHLEHGKKREIRRLLYALGYDARRLQRYQIGGYRLRGLAPGQVKPLSEADVKLLFSGA